MLVERMRNALVYIAYTRIRVNMRVRMYRHIYIYIYMHAFYRGLFAYLKRWLSFPRFEG